MHSNSPLDYEESVEQEIETLKSWTNYQGYYLELFPILVICLGLFLHFQGNSWWQETIIVGGGLAVFFYLFLSWYLFRVGTYRQMELLFSILAGLFFSMGIIGILLHLLIWRNASLFLGIGFGGSVILFCGTFISFIFHLNDDRASIFYRNLLARLMIFIAILARLYPLY